MKKYILLFCLGLFSFISCENEEVITGAEGYIMKSPISPVEIQGQLNYAPLMATFYVYNTQGSIVLKFNSNSDGWYHVALLPGTYTVVPDKSAPIMSPQFQSKLIKVESVGYTKIDLSFDTGIR